MKNIIISLIMLAGMAVCGCDAAVKMSPGKTVRPVYHGDFHTITEDNSKVYVMEAKAAYHFAKRGNDASMQAHQWHLNVTKFGTTTKTVLHLSMKDAGLTSEQNKKFLVIDPGTITQPSSVYYIVVY